MKVSQTERSEIPASMRSGPRHVVVTTHVVITRVVVLRSH
jgi:hypothetical protein